ncbi:hypothetical protein CJ030_MR3G026673 [Morella rubra]|uniref:Uncharacterized protein n=1 Tax=Morella rubra TaxID=262757 RepID=A0A6A1W1N9_9ROSI|nr:hypothetical protein CJ030_MR3G026673 [Morella rubra]
MGGVQRESGGSGGGEPSFGARTIVAANSECLCAFVHIRKYLTGSAKTYADSVQANGHVRDVACISPHTNFQDSLRVWSLPLCRKCAPSRLKLF